MMMFMIELKDELTQSTEREKQSHHAEYLQTNHFIFQDMIARNLEFPNKDENATRNLWNLDEVINFVFSKKYQAKYYETATSFMKLLMEKHT